jgi:hypothetical protein
MTADVDALVAGHLRSATSSWSIGAFGAIAEFHRGPLEAVAFSGLSAVTERGAIALRPDVRCRAVAYETLSARTGLWLHGIALCLAAPDARMDVHTAITGLGADREALRAQDREAALFDLGLGLINCQFCVRTGDPGLRDALRAAQGTSLLANAHLVGMLKSASPHRVMRSGAGRIEVFQDIAPEGGASPAGPHTHLLPPLLRPNLTHAANVPIPEGWLPCATLYPPNPVLDPEGAPKPFDHQEHSAFQALLERFGDPEHARVKREVSAAVRKGERPDAPLAGRRARAACRVALRQLRQTDGASQALDLWRGEFDAAPAREITGAH